MRTTVTLEPDVLALLRADMHRRGISFKEALNQAVRAGLTPTSRRAAGRIPLKTYKMGYRPGVDLDKALALAGALEDHELARRLDLRQ